MIRPTSGNDGVPDSASTDLEDPIQYQNQTGICNTITPVPDDWHNVTSTESNEKTPSTIAALSEPDIKGDNNTTSKQGVNTIATTLRSMSVSQSDSPVADSSISSKGGNVSPDTSKIITGQNDYTATDGGVTKGDNEISTFPKASSSSNDLDTGDTKDPLDVNSDISVDVQRKIYVLWENEVKKGNSCVPLVKIMESDIKQFQPREPSIDPYLSLEDIGDTSIDEEPVEGEPQPEKQNSDIDIDQTTQYYMRECKTLRQRTSMKPLRENRTPVNYADIIGSDQDSSLPKRPKKHPRVSSAPSSSRIAAQDEIHRRDLPKGKPSTPVVPACKFTTKDPSRSIPVHWRNLKVKPPSDLDTVMPIPDEHDEPEEELVTPKGSFATENHGLKKYKPDRWFKCPVCGIHKGTTHRLNDHYKR